jgi:hypothetical protein
VPATSSEQIYDHGAVSVSAESIVLAASLVMAAGSPAAALEGEEASMPKWKTSSTWRRYKAAFDQVDRVGPIKSMRALERLNDEIYRFEYYFPRAFPADPALADVLMSVLREKIAAIEAWLQRHPGKGPRRDRKRDVVEGIEYVDLRADALRRLLAAGVDDPWVGAVFVPNVTHSSEALDSSIDFLQRDEARSGPEIPALVAKAQRSVDAANVLIARATGVAKGKGEASVPRWKLWSAWPEYKAAFDKVHETRTMTGMEKLDEAAEGIRYTLTRAFAATPEVAPALLAALQERVEAVRRKVQAPRGKRAPPDRKGDLAEAAGILEREAAALRLLRQARVDDPWVDTGFVPEVKRAVGVVTAALESAQKEAPSDPEVPALAATAAKTIEAASAALAQTTRRR